MMEPLVLATNNEGKIKELTALLSKLPFKVIPQTALNVAAPEETGITFVENALLKARHASNVTGLPALADDSGLVVPALSLAPGIFSARYAGPAASDADNVQKLLTELQNVPKEERQAWFYCVIVMLSRVDDPVPLICEGKWHGTILTKTRGTNGFGYDPVFYVTAKGKTAAELPLAIKNKMSHRAKALKSLIRKLPEKL